jgi:hypothetical protein
MPIPHNPQWDQVTWAQLAPRLKEYRDQAERDLCLKLAPSQEDYLRKFYHLESVRWLEEKVEFEIKKMLEKKELKS